MAKIISEMYPVQKETVPSVSTSEGEDSESVTSDIGKQELMFSEDGFSQAQTNFNKFFRQLCSRADYAVPVKLLLYKRACFNLRLSKCYKATEIKKAKQQKTHKNAQIVVQKLAI